MMGVLEPVEAFITRWEGVSGTERANYQLFLTELCAVLELPQPEPASRESEKNAYVFERVVETKTPSGEVSRGFIDLYRRGAFVCEAKQSGVDLDTDRWEKAMLKAQSQADNYVRSLPESEGRPPFILVVDVGRNIDVYAEFTRSGGTYTPFPDPRSHRIRLQDLRQEAIRERLRAIWRDPLNLDPSRHAAKVTREIADKLARLARSLEARGKDSQQVVSFLIRALFTMFAEDVGLLPDRGFTELLESLRSTPGNFAPMLESLWSTMNFGGFSPILRTQLLRFNGGLFADFSAIPLERDEFELLYEAARTDWRYVEPAIFGTLLERALDSRERHKLGAHYTPRAYVERLVFPTVIDPLRYEWGTVKAAALVFDEQGKKKEALAHIHDFQRRLATTRVLDPACGSANFLYVTMEHMKRLEGEILQLLEQLGEDQTLLDMEGFIVNPQQFLGIEINPRAAKIAELVLWIGYLQWHFRTHGEVAPKEPILRDFKNIENRDALIEYDRKELLRDASGKPVTRWDGVTMKTSPITGELIPDEAAQMEQYVYINPRKATWPQADYIVGNPPFIGNKRMRSVLGDGYVEAVRSVWKSVPESSDFVMYWWDYAAELTRSGNVTRFGYITTNSIRQSFNRRVLETHMAETDGVSLVYAVPDHPWVDGYDGAAVRIAITVGRRGGGDGCVGTVLSGEVTEPDFVLLHTGSGMITPNLSLGVDVAVASHLNSNRGLACPGVQLSGKGFVINSDDEDHFSGSSSEVLVRPFVIGSDLVRTPRNVCVIDATDLSENELMANYPLAFQWLVDRVKPDRVQNPRETYRKYWWRFSEPRFKFRPAMAGLICFIGTCRTAKHRVFSFLPQGTVCETTVVVIASSSAATLGVLSSSLHVCWAIAAGGRLGVGNDPRYQHQRTFNTFPFPVLSPDQSSQIGELAERIDAHRKRQQSLHENLTLTNMYNVLEKLRSGEVLNAKERETHEQGLVSVLRELHDALDRAVFDAYGWSDLGDILVGRPGATTPLLDKDEDQAAAEEELLRRLVALNAERAEEEKSGLIRWLRPEYQNPTGTTANIDADTQEELLEEDAPAALTVDVKQSPWPKSIPEQIAAVRTLVTTTKLTDVNDIAAQFKGGGKKKLAEVGIAVESLRVLGIF